MDRQAIGRAYMAARAARGWTLRDLADKSGISYSYIQQIEKPLDRTNVTLKALQTVGQALGLEVVVGDATVADVYGILAAVPDDQLAHLRTALLSLASLPADELELEADMLARRAARSAQNSVRGTGT
jgi:transcriptional regulator with XRE-family HTH domain